MFQELTVDLRCAPENRWHLTPLQCTQARELLALYTADLGLRPDVAQFLTSSVKDLVPRDHWREMESLSRAMELPLSDVVLCNLYYDALKVVLSRAFGCTAFAIDAPGGILHARNRDWWTENSALARYTTLAHFVGGPAGKFSIIGWPGFVGVLSGIAPGRFAVTLNAVLSTDPTQLATPVVFLLRTVFEQAATFDDALALLNETPLPCDCLLLLTGVRVGELVVIERTPSRHALRYAKNGYVSVTNGYQELNAGIGSAPSELLATWCQRFERVEALIQNRLPQNPEDCFTYLNDPQARMNMTVQQMVFRAATGEHWLRFPGPVATSPPPPASTFRRPL
jgi:acid ceramidase